MTCLWLFFLYSVLWKHFRNSVAWQKSICLGLVDDTHNLSSCFIWKSYFHFNTHHFLFGAQHTQFSEAHMERGALVGAVLLLDHHYIDATWKRGLVNALIQLLHGHQHLTGQLPHVIHAVRLKRGTESKTNLTLKHHKANNNYSFFNLSHCISIWQMWHDFPISYTKSEILFGCLPF